MDIIQEEEILKSLPDHPDRFALIFDAYYPIIFRYILRRTWEIELAEDITSETFLCAVRKISSFRFEWVSILHWLYKIASHEVALYFRKQKMSIDSLEDLWESTGFDPKSDEDIVEEMIAMEIALKEQKDFQKAQKILSSLPTKYGEVIALRFLEEKSLKEIAEILGKKEGTIKSLLSRGMEKLKGMME
jgi:RNA polymerase sigma-70 factor, ECF subfamily